VLGKDETISTVQIDFTLPERFNLEYIGEDGQPHQPVMIHRGGISTLERFMAFLIENYAGAFPLWLAPVQAVVIPISDEKHGEYAESVAERLREAGLRAEVDARHERMNAKVRDAQLQKIPYMLVVGDKEAAADAVAVRLRSNENLGAVPIDDFIRQAKQIVADRSQELWSAQQPA
jgi:threonyl-tRNA synthetase